MATKLHIYYAQARESIDAPTLATLKQDASSAIAWQQTYAKSLELEHLVVLHQVHGAHGYAVPQDVPAGAIPFAHAGDFLVTQERGCGLAVLTADCLPVVFYDPVQQAIGVVHAGWPGSLAGISVATIDALRTRYGSVPADITISFGPCARWCCYEVGHEVHERIMHTYPWAACAFVERQEKLFFDLVTFNAALLVRAGVDAHACTQEHASCTMCTPRYYSHRRQKESAGRNITVVWLE